MALPTTLSLYPLILSLSKDAEQETELSYKQKFTLCSAPFAKR